MGRPVKMSLAAISPESYLHFCTDIFFSLINGEVKKSYSRAKAES